MFGAGRRTGQGDLSDIPLTVHALRLVIAPESRLTSFAGIVVFQSLSMRLDLKEHLRSCFDRPAGQSIFQPAGVMLPLVVHLLLGFRRLRGLQSYQHDGLVAHLVDWSRLPDVSTVSRSLAAMTVQSIQAVRSLLRRLVTYRLAADRSRA